MPYANDRSSRRRLTIGLVGYGLWGRNILRDLIELGQHVVVAEPDVARADAARNAGARRVVARWEELPDVNGAIVATSASTHAAVTLGLLSRNIPLLVEKPLTTDVESAREIARRAGDRVFVGHVWRYHGGIEKLAALARSGELGSISGLRTRRLNGPSPRTDVDTTWTLLPHDLSIAHHVLGCLPPPRHAVAEVREGRCVGLIATLGKSPLVVLEVSNCSTEKVREVILLGSKGMAVASETVVEIFGDNRAPSKERCTIDAEPALRRELREFCAHCSGGPPLPTSAAEGLAVVEQIVALRGLAGID